MKKLLLVLSVAAWAVIPPATAGEDVVTVTASGISFSPKTVTVDIGEKVEWINPNSGFHNVRFEDGQYEEPAIPSNDWPAPVERTFATEGTYAYYCENHGGPGGSGMSGTVIVVDPLTVPPTTELTKPLDGKTYPKSKTGTFRGTAIDPQGPVFSVEIALRRKKTNGDCGWWDGGSFVPGPCSAKQFLGAEGTDTWSYALGTTLKPSMGTNIANYTMYSRANDTDGNTEDQFEKGRNLARFEVKPD